MGITHTDELDAVYTTIDANATGDTTIYSGPSEPNNTALVYGVYMVQGGATSEVSLKVTDGSDTVVLADIAGGATLSFTDDICLGPDDSLVLTVDTAEGTTQSDTAVVFVGERK